MKTATIRTVRAAYPLMLDVTDRLVVIVGGGGVAVRKARGLLDAGATQIRMIALNFRDDTPVAVHKISGPFEKSYLQGAALVFAATDSTDVNDAVVREARALGIWVNRADTDEEEPGDFITPAVLRKGQITLTVSTGGSPALATLVRDELAARFDPRWREMADAMKTIRPAVLAARFMSGDRRRAAFGDLATEGALAALSQGGAEGLWRWIVAKYPELT